MTGVIEIVTTARSAIYSGEGLEAVVEYINARDHDQAEINCRKRMVNSAMPRSP